MKRDTIGLERERQSKEVSGRERILLEEGPIVTTGINIFIIFSVSINGDDRGGGLELFLKDNRCAADGIILES